MRHASSIKFMLLLPAVFILSACEKEFTVVLTVYDWKTGGFAKQGCEITAVSADSSMQLHGVIAGIVNENGTATVKFRTTDK